MRRSSLLQTPVAFVRSILAAYERRGMDPGPALRQAGITLADLDSNPSERIAVEPFEALSALAMRELDDEALGWFSRRLPWGSYGMLLRASLTAPTLDIALRRWCRHHGLLTEDLRIGLQSDGTTCRFRIEEQADLDNLREFCLVSLLRNLHGVACWLIDSRIALSAVRFPFPAPGHAATYGRMFAGEIAFDAPGTELVFDAGYLRLPIMRDDEALRLLLQRPIPLMARQYRQDRMLTQRIIGFLASDFGRSVDATTVADHLGLSMRSLQRHLREEGTSLQAIRSNACRLRAEDLLRRRDLPIKRVARLVGYGDESSFGRAFRGWTGRTPAEFRRDSLSAIAAVGSNPARPVPSR